MTMQTIPITPLFSPVPYLGGSSNNTTLDTTDDWLAGVFYWPGGDFTKFAFYCVTATGSPVVTGQLFNTDPSDASATPVNTASPIGSAVDSATLVTGTPFTISGIGQSALAAGAYAPRLIFKSGTSCVIKRFDTGASMFGNANAQFPYHITVANGGAQTRSQAAALAMAVGGSSFVPVPGLVPPVAITAQTFQDTSNPDEYGLWIINPYPVAVRICGVFFWSLSNARPDIRLAYYTGNFAAPVQALAQTFDRDLSGNLAGNGPNYFPFSTKQTLAVGGAAGIGVRATTTNLMGIDFWDFLTGNEPLMDSMWGQNATLFTREGDAGALTQTTFRTPLLFPLIDGIDDGVGGSVPLSRPTIMYV